MQDRVPTKPGRVLITPENGGTPYYATMTRADEPTQVGDALNKANLLDDNTCVALDIPTTSVPNDAFMRVAPWRLLKVYSVAGAYTFNPSDYPNITELGAFIVGGGGSGTATQASLGYSGGYFARGGGSGHSNIFITKDLTKTYAAVVGQGGASKSPSGEGNDGNSSSFGGKVALGGSKGLTHSQYAVPGAAGGQGASQTGLTTPAFGEIQNLSTDTGGTNPNECINPFDNKRLLIAGGYAYGYIQSGVMTSSRVQSPVIDDYGNVGSTPNVVNTSSATAIKGTSYGCGGSGALSTYVSPNIPTSTSAAGCDGAVLIYGR